MFKNGLQCGSILNSVLGTGFAEDSQRISPSLSLDLPVSPVMCRVANWIDKPVNDVMFVQIIGAGQEYWSVLRSHILTANLFCHGAIRL